MMSRLPDDPAYWEKLTNRLVADTAELRGERLDTSIRWRTLARLSTPLATGAAAAVIIALLQRLGTTRDPLENSTASAYGLLPRDPVAALLLTSVNAHTMATLLSTPTSERIR